VTSRRRKGDAGGIELELQHEVSSTVQAIQVIVTLHLMHALVLWKVLEVSLAVSWRVVCKADKGGMIDGSFAQIANFPNAHARTMSHT